MCARESWEREEHIIPAVLYVHALYLPYTGWLYDTSKLQTVSNKARKRVSIEQSKLNKKQNCRSYCSRY